VFLRPLEHNLMAIRGDVEIVYVEIGGEVRQLPLSAGLDVDEPEILCWISPRRSTSVRPQA
jgi:hypothetical protein